MTNPSQLYGRPWSEREYIIVLYSYLQHRGEPRHHLRDYVKDLAALLGRTPGSIVMRMENYASIDPAETHKRKGLVNISALGQAVFNTWINKPESLKDCAELLIRESRQSALPDFFEPEPVKMPKAFGKYDLLDALGEGGFGSVYSCINSADEKAYAMKIIHGDKVSEPEMLGRFRREIRALKSVQHPNVIRIHEDNLDQERNFPAFIMDLGQCTLGDYLERVLADAPRDEGRPLLPKSEAIEIVMSAINAVKTLHQNKPRILHRDIKPANILRMPDGIWLLADFSLAKFASSALVTTTFSTLSRQQGWGSDSYTAPEQWRDFKNTDERADIYSLGVLTWELFSPGWPPFDRSCLNLTSKLETLVLKATQRDRDDRHDSVAQFQREFLIALR
jgi:serine/threonine protein kinase